jgi:hypothetical protein
MRWLVAILDITKTKEATKAFFLTLGLLVLFGLMLSAKDSKAEVYKCMVGGKTTYTDVPCPAAKKIDANPNTYSAEPINVYRARADEYAKIKKCDDLKDQMDRSAPDPSRQTVGEVMAAKHNYQLHRQNYELECLSPQQRNTAAQERTDDNLRSLQRQQINIKDQQRQLSEKQRRMEFEQRKQQRILDGY